MYHQFLDRYKRLIPFILIFLFSIFVIYLYWHRDFDSDDVIIESSMQIEQEDVNNTILVDISGEVLTKGVYEMEDGSRIRDLILKAGGFTENADLNYIEKELNQAAILNDGQKIYIPSKIKNLENKALEDITTGTTQININTASAATLDSLWGIGEIRAQDIINNRPYRNKGDLVLRNIIPQSVYEKIENQITI